MIEVEAHSCLRDFLRERGNAVAWPHYLTMTRLVARALRLKRSALIQTGAFTYRLQAAYRLSYLIPALLHPEAAILVVPETLPPEVLLAEISQLQAWLQGRRSATKEVVFSSNGWPSPDFSGLLITSAENWLADRLFGQGKFPPGVPAIADGADDLEARSRSVLTAAIHPQDWDALMNSHPQAAEMIRDARVQLTKYIFQHPANPYECCLVEELEQAILERLSQRLAPSAWPENWQRFWRQWQQSGQLLWASIIRDRGRFSLHCSPASVAAALSPVWQQQPAVIIGSFMDLDPQAGIYRQQLGLGDLTCLKFSGDRQNEMIRLYLPERLPLPNTPRFLEVLIEQSRTILRLGSAGSEDELVPAASQLPQFATILVGDVPLKAQAAAALAAEFGSRVQVEKTSAAPGSILVTGWEFWRSQQQVLPVPQILIIATLPIPSLEDPLVAGQVAYYKKSRKDWFRLYLLPVALRELQRAIAPVRESQGIVAILDSRVHHRSYGQQVLAALGPMARINYLDPSWLD